jgi:hypothetical protein
MKPAHTDKISKDIFKKQATYHKGDYTVLMEEYWNHPR